MENTQLGPGCPRCGDVDAPRLIVRDTGTPTSDAGLPNVRLRCRRCDHEWSSLPREQWAS